MTERPDLHGDGPVNYLDLFSRDGPGQFRITPALFPALGVAAAVEAAVLAYLAYLILVLGWAYVQAHPDEIQRRIKENVPFSGMLGGLNEAITKFLSENEPKSSEEVPRPEWGSSKHADRLPKNGDLPYEPPKTSHGKPMAKKGGGFVDKKGREWTWDKSKHGGEHWDVKDPRTGKHDNVYPNGKIRPGSK